MASVNPIQKKANRCEPGKGPVMAATPLLGVIDHNLSVLILNTEPSCSVMIGIILHFCGNGVQRATTAAQAIEFPETPPLM